MIDAVRTGLIAALDIVTPTTCAGCGRLDHVICADCGADLFGPARRVDQDAPLLRDGPPTWAAASYSGPVRDLVLAWKRGRRDVRPLVAEAAGALVDRWATLDGAATQTLTPDNSGESFDAVVRIDRRSTGHDRSAYYRRKFDEALGESGVRVSVVAEQDGMVAGFLMARVDFGEFGRAATAAVIDTIGVDAAASGKHVGRALVSQLLANLTSLHVESVRTEVEWNRFDLLRFLDRCGFRPGQQLSLSRPLV